jgi:hypothetical protein
MDIQGTHEDTDEESLVMEIIILLRLFDNYNLSVSRGNDQFLRVSIEIADRTTVEIKGECPHRTKDKKECPKRDRVINGIPKNHSDTNQ